MNWKYLKRVIKSAIGRDLLVRPSVTLPTEFIGTDYGGWEILKSSLQKSDVVYSFGIGEDISFDLGLIERYGCKVDAFDPSPRSLRWLESQQVDQRFIAHPYGIYSEDKVLEFFEPADVAHVSFSAHTPGRGASIQCPVRTLQRIVGDLGHTRISLLKMDIEGSEYEVIPSILASGIEIDQWLIEFHHRLLAGGVEKTRQSLALLKAAGFKLYAVSSRGEEFSFVHERKLSK